MKIIIILCMIISANVFAHFYTSTTISNENLSPRLVQHIDQALTYVNDKGYHSSLAVLIDFAIPSKNYRFFLVDLQKKTILKKGLVAHGDCKDWSENYTTPHFSNTPNSQCSSLGKYILGEKYQSKIWGTAYRIKGLESTNNNALSRGVVIHGHDDLPYEENGDFINTSYGCPMLNKKFFKEMQMVFDTLSSPMLVWAYN